MKQIHAGGIDMEQFRRAAAGDMDEIMRVIGEAQSFMRTLNIDQWQDGYPDRGTLLNDIAIGQLYVIGDGAGIAAVAALSLLPEPTYDEIEGKWLSDGPYLTVHRMALDDAHRGGGMAGRMLEEAVAIARVNRCESLRVDTHRGNRAMRRFLEKSGFEECGLVYYTVKLGDPVRVAYEKRI